eukprot:6204569-Pleurochrysis_carterae.AAC.2
MRSCETTHLPLDDREVRAAIRKCVPDAHGKIGIEQFVQTLKMRWTPSEPKPSKGGERIWELQHDFLRSPCAPIGCRMYDAPMHKGGPEPITKMLRPVLPAHAYKASDLPPSPTKKVAKWNDNQEASKQQLAQIQLGCKPRGRMWRSNSKHANTTLLSNGAGGTAMALPQCVRDADGRSAAASASPGRNATQVQEHDGATGGNLRYGRESAACLARIESELR